MIKYIILILICTSIIFCKEKQNSVSQLDSENISESNYHVYIGIRDEFITMYGHYFNQKIVESSSPLNLHLATGVGFSKHYKVDLRFGLNLVSEVGNFGGWDIGMYFLTDLLNTNIFANAGIDCFEVYKFAHGPSSGGGVIVFYCFGLGYNISSNFGFDILYYIPNRKKYGNDAVQGPYLVDGLIKIGFQYSFIF